MDVVAAPPLPDRAPAPMGPGAPAGTGGSRTVPPSMSFAAHLAGAAAPAPVSSPDTPWVDGGDCRCGVGDGAARLDGAGVPREYRTFGAGRLPAAVLEPVGTPGVVLWPPAASSYRALREAAAADGLRVDAVGGYRPGDARAAWGTQVDLRYDEPARAWLAARASSFGFVAAGGTAWAYRPTH